MTRIGILGSSQNDIFSCINFLSEIYNFENEVEIQNFSPFDFTVKNNFKNKLKINQIPYYSDLKQYSPDMILILDGNFHHSYTALLSNKTLLINSDDTTIFPFLDNINARIVTFGYNNKSSVTTSSIIDDIIVQICVQRPFFTISQETVIEQEFPLYLNKSKLKNYSINNCIYGILGAVCICLFNNCDINVLNKPSLAYLS